jgi:hypothetical protein
MSVYAPLHHAVFAFGAAQSRSCPDSGRASARVGNWPDPMRRNCGSRQPAAK